MTGGAVDRPVANSREGFMGQGSSSSSSWFAAVRLLVPAVVAGLLLSVGVAGTSGQDAGAGASLGVASVPGDELTELRTRSSRTFVDESGSRVTRLYQGAVNFRDGDGDWRPIDNDLVPSADGGGSIENSANRYRLTLPRDLTDAPMRVAAEGAWVDYQLRDARATATVDGAVATYREARTGLALKYTARADGVKEEIQVDSPAAARDLAFDMRLSAGLVPVTRRDGGVDLRDEAGNVRFAIERPFMIDSSRGAEPSYAISYELERTAEGFELSVRPDRQWLESPERVWPVTIDPTTVIEPLTPDCMISQGSPTASDCGGSALEVGYDAANHGAHDHRALLWVDGDGFPNRRAVVLSARLRMHLNQKTTSNVVPVSVHGVQSDSNPTLDRPWTTAATWNQWKAGSAWTNAGGDFESPALATTDVGSATGWKDWHLDPHRVQDWIDRSRAPRGVLVKTQGAAGAANHLRFGSTDGASQYAPYVELTWDQVVGQKPEYTFERQRLSDRMGLEVNVAAGNLRVTNTDQQIAGTGLDHAIARTYDSLAVWPDGAAARYWSLNTAPDVHLELYGDGSAGFYGPSGAPLAFHKTGANQWRPPAGVHATLVTEGAGYKLTFRDSLGVWHFDSTGRPTEHEDRNGNAIAFVYDGSGLLESATDTQGRETTFDFGGDGRIEEIVDSAGRHHLYEHDDEMLESYTDPAGETTYYEYSGILLSEVTDPRGNRTLFGYDSAGRVEEIVRVTDDYAGTGPTWTFEYDTGDGRCPASTRSNEMEDPRGNETVWCHDTRYRVVKTIDANGNQRDAAWSPTNALLSTTAPGSAQTTMGYDPIDNLESVDEPAGENSALSYGHAQHERFPTGMTSPQGTSSLFAYDTIGNTTTISDGGSPTQVEAKLEYNGQAGGVCGDDPTTKPGTLRCAVDGKGNETLYGYDDVGNLTSVMPELPLGDTTIAYDSLSRVDTVEDGKGQTRSYSYDLLDRVTEIDYGGGEIVSFDYDANGNQIERVDSVHGTSTWAYDELNRRVEDDLPSGDTDYAWDAASNLTSLTDAGGTVSYRYDDVNRLMDLAEPGGSCTAPVSLCTTFGYTTRDQRERTTYPNGVEQTVTFDSSDKPTRIKALKAGSPPTTLTDFTYVYERTLPTTSQTALRHSVTDKDGNETTYGYDYLDRLTEAVERNSGNTVIDDRSYDYDLASNRQSQTINGATTSYAYNAANQLCWTYSGVSGAACGSPPGGATTYSYDLNGNTTATSAGVDFDYNVRDQTTSLTLGAGSPLSFGYAGAGQSERTSRAGIAQHNTLLGLSRESTTSWTRDPGGTLISQRASGGIRHYYLADGLGSVVGLTDSTGALSRSYKYDPYGALRSTTGSTPNPFQYTGQYSEAGGGLYKIGARYYAPGFGRWTQLDPLDQAGDLREGNRYIYAGSDPVNLTDPTGTISLGDIGDIVKGVGRLLTAATVVYCAGRGTIAGWEASGNTNTKSSIKASLTGPYAFFKEGYECAKPPFL